MTLLRALLAAGLLLPMLPVALALADEAPPPAAAEEVVPDVEPSREVAPADAPPEGASPADAPSADEKALADRATPLEGDREAPAGPRPAAGVTHTTIGRPCGANPLLAVSPVRPEQVRHLSPIGTLVPPDHVFPTPHMYFYVQNDTTPADIEVPVYAPGDVIVTSIALRHYDRLGQKADYTDYTLTFSVCDDVELYFHHLRRLTHPLLGAALAAQGCTPAGPGGEKFCSFPVRVPIPAGEAMATTGDRLAGVGGLDLGARDYRLEAGRAAFANPDRWCAATGFQLVYDHCYTICPLDLLPPEQQAILLDRFLDFTGTVRRTDAPQCGTLYHDLPGTAQGHWFAPVEAPRSVEAPHLFLGPSTFASGVQAFSAGTSIPALPGRLYLFRPQSDGRVNRPFRDVVSDQVSCYERLFLSDADAALQRNPMPNLTLLVQLRRQDTAANGQATLLVEARATPSCGPGPWQLGPAAAVFSR